MNEFLQSPYRVIGLMLGIVAVSFGIACTSTEVTVGDGDAGDDDTSVAHGDVDVNATQPDATAPADTESEPGQDTQGDVQGGDAGDGDAGVDGGDEQDVNAGDTDVDNPDTGEVDTGAEDPPNGEVPLGFDNRFGIGLVGPGDATDMQLTADLVGPEGFIKIIFPGVTADTTGPEAAWSAAVQIAYERDLIPVIRIGPPWGDRRVRNQADDETHLTYTQLAQAYRNVVEALPLRDGWPVWIEIHNEPNLCYEWECDPGATDDGWMGYEQIASEYAHMMRDVAQALRDIGDPRIKITNGGLAPGGVTSCECGGDGFNPGITSMDFINAMEAAVPGVFNELDGWSSHPYPAEGEGWGFMVPYDQAMTGLLFHHLELEAVGLDLPVLITETGWNLDHGDRNDVATWMVQAYQDPWLTDETILGVMPFMLRDPGWDHFGWTAPDGTPYPVYNAVRDYRCQTIPGNCPQ